MLMSTLREQDLVSRWGGDEFVVLLSECDDQLLLSLVEKILNIVNLGKDQLYSVGCSIGVTSGVPASIEELTELIDKADKAMYISKNKGRGVASVYRE